MNITMHFNLFYFHKLVKGQINKAEIMKSENIII